MALPYLGQLGRLFEGNVHKATGNLSFKRRNRATNATSETHHTIIVRLCTYVAFRTDFSALHHATDTLLPHAHNSAFFARQTQHS